MTDCTCADGRAGTEACSTERVLLACDCAPGARDGGATSDAGGTADDAGPSNDAGATDDAGTSSDAGTPSDAGSLGDAGQPAQVSLGDFCTQFPQAVCERRIGCGEYADAGVDTCRARESARIAQSCQRADAGYVDFNGVQAAGCLAQLRGAALCFDFLEPCGVSNTVFPERATGCGLATCGPNTFCDRDCFQPTCRTFRQLGQSCDDGSFGTYAPCDATTGFCGSADGGTAWSCLSFKPVGGACQTGQCGPSGLCVYGTSPTCAALLPDEAPCTANNDCSSFLCRADRHCGALDAGVTCSAAQDCGAGVCRGLSLGADGGVASTGTCGPVAQLGETCDRQWARFGRSCDFLGGKACLDGVCKQVPVGTQGLNQECPLRPWGFFTAPYLGFLACQPGLSCQPTSDPSTPRTGRCRPANTEGDPCLDPLACLPGFTCATAADGGQTCQRRHAFGEACPSRGGCLDELTCLQQADGGFACLQPLGLDAGGCIYSDSCVDQATCAGGTCVSKGGLGDACTYGFECLSGGCGNGRCVAQCNR